MSAQCQTTFTSSKNWRSTLHRDHNEGHQPVKNFRWDQKLHLSQWNEQRSKV